MKIHKWLLLAFLGATAAIKAPGQVNLPSLPDPALFPASSPQERVFPERGRTADRNFWLVTGINGAAVAADAWTTVALIGPGSRNCPREVWNPGLYGSRPSAGRTAAVMGGLYTASVATSWILKRQRVHLGKFPIWIVPQAYNAYGHTIGAAHNLEVCQ